MDISTIKLQNILLVCGILSVLLAVGTDVLLGKLLRGYSFSSQSVSELSAAGASTRPAAVVLNFLFAALIAAFAVGIWRASPSLAARITAVMVVGNALAFLVSSMFFPPQAGQSSLATPASRLGVMLGAAGVLFMLLALGFGAAASQGWYRAVPIGILAAYAVLAALRILNVFRISAGQSTVGVQERTMMLMYLIWAAIFAISLMRKG